MKFRKRTFAQEWRRASPSEQAEMLGEPHWTDGPTAFYEKNEAEMSDYDYYGSYGHWGQFGWNRDRNYRVFHGNFGVRS